MKKINRILKQLGDLYEFNQRIKGYTLKKREATNSVAHGSSSPTTTTPHIKKWVRSALDSYKKCH